MRNHRTVLHFPFPAAKREGPHASISSRMLLLLLYFLDSAVLAGDPSVLRRNMQAGTGTGTAEHLRRRPESRAHAAQRGAVTHGPADLTLPLLKFPSRVRAKKENFQPWAQGPVCRRLSSSLKGRDCASWCLVPSRGAAPPTAKKTPDCVGLKGEKSHRRRICKRPLIWEE